MAALEAQTKTQMNSTAIERLPDIIKDKISVLEDLIKDHPDKIPVTKAAKFLGMDVECLKRCIEQGKVPFAFGCDNDKYGNRYSYVSSVKFYLWVISPLL